MTNSSSSSHADSGIATMTAIAAIGNPRRISGSKRYILDAQIYVGSKQCESLLGALSYFNNSDMAFGEGEIGLYLIYSTIAKFDDTRTPDVHRTPVSPARYDFIGDIQWIVPLANPSSDPDADSSVFPIDTCRPAYIHVSGVASNCQRELGTFDLEIEQYISMLRGDNASLNSRGIAAISCTIPDSPRYKFGKPTPYNKKYVSVSGFLTDVVFDPNSMEIIRRFHINVDNIVFLGQQSSSGANSDAPVRTPRPGKQLISYNRWRSATPAATAPTPSAPITPTRSSTQASPSRKRPRLETDDSLDDFFAEKENVREGSVSSS